MLSIVATARSACPSVHPSSTEHIWKLKQTRAGGRARSRKNAVKCGAKLLNLSHRRRFHSTRVVHHSVSQCNNNARGAILSRVMVLLAGVQDRGSCCSSGIYHHLVKCVVKPIPSNEARLQHFLPFIKNWKWKGVGITENPFANTR